MTNRKEKKCPLCFESTETSSYFGHFRSGGICTDCYEYLKGVFQVILAQNIIQGLEYLADLKSREE